MTLDRVIKNRDVASWKIKQIEIAQNARPRVSKSEAKKGSRETEWVSIVFHGTSAQRSAEGYLVPNNDNVMN